MSNPFWNNIERYDIDITQGGEGAALWDEENGTWLLDFWCDESTCGAGYGQFVRDAIMDFVDSGQPHQLPDIFPNSIRTTTAKRLCDAYNYDKIFFANSGAEAIETALKMSRKYWYERGFPNKKYCYTFEGNFHGRTYGALALSDSYGSGSAYHKEGFAPSDRGWGSYGVVTPNTYKLINVSETAAIFLAPILGNNCVKAYPNEFYQELRDFCDANDILLVFDEIQSGSGWTGKMSAADYFDVRPDIMCLGKRIALGFPMSAVLADSNIANAIGLGQHFNTFAGSPFICYMAAAWLNWLEDGGLEEITSRGLSIGSTLRQLDFVKDVNQYGMMCSFMLDYDNLPYDGEQFCKTALKHGLLIVTHRKNGEIRFTPPCTVTYEQLETAFAALVWTHNECLSHNRRTNKSVPTAQSAKA